MGSAEGALRTAAKRVGLTPTEYLDRLNAGLLWCSRDQTWEPAEEFAADRSRRSGRAGSCRRSQNAQARRAYLRRPRPAAGRRFVAARDDDKLQARRRVNYLVEAALIPAPASLPCADCGEVGSRHEYDHHKGYSADHHEDVEPVCIPCHRARETSRRVLDGRTWDDYPGGTS